MKRELRYEGRVVKDLRRLDSGDKARILAALERLVANGEGDIRPLRGEFAGSYRLRVGKWRVASKGQGSLRISSTTEEKPTKNADWSCF